LPAAVERTTAERGAIRLLAQRALCEQSFPEFLTYLSIRSDDPNDVRPQRLVPWGFQIERAQAWQAGGNEIILKERQTGFSSALVAPYFLWRSMYWNWQCAYTSVDQPAARKQIARIKAIYDLLPRHLRAPGAFRTDDAAFDGGGGITAFASTDHAGISYTFQLWAQDEAAFHPYGAENYAAIMPAVANGQAIILSTADPSLGPSGHFHDLYWNSKKGETEFRAIFEARRRPDRDAAWYARMRRQYVGREEEFDAYYPDSDAAAFVARSGLVFPQFSTDRHVQAAPFPIESAVRVVAGVDFGGGDPTAIVILAMDGAQRIHQMAEFYERGPVGADRLGAFLSQYPVDAVMCDPSQGTAIATLQQTFGLPARPADNRRGDGLGLVAFLLEHDRLTIDPSCTNSIAEFPGYRWATRVDPSDKTRYATSTATDNHADAQDARRYACAELLAMLMPHARMPSTTLSGRPLARRAV
jgi:hypothetical protein